MGKKKAGFAERSVEQRRCLIEPENEHISIARQCELLEFSRSGYYYEPCPESRENLRLMRLIDEQYLETPFYGYRRMAAQLVNDGYAVNLKRIRRLMRLMGLEAIYQKPRTSVRNKEHIVYPYLLRNVAIERVSQVWSTDITYVPMQHGFLFLVAVMDWRSRYVLSWRLSNTMDVGFCIEALSEALSEALERHGKPEIFNTDQGSQFTSPQFTGILLKNDIAISMDGKGRAIDNVLIERLWRSVKYECLYLHRFEQSSEVYAALSAYIDLHNNRKPHQALNYKTPSDVFFAAGNPATGLLQL
jgi:putative transposase